MYFERERYFSLNSRKIRSHMYLELKSCVITNSSVYTALLWISKLYLGNHSHHEFEVKQLKSSGSVEWVSEVAQSCLTLCDPMDCSWPGSSHHGILQARILEWVAISFSRGSSWSRDQTQVPRIVDGSFTIWATSETTRDCRKKNTMDR